METAIALFEIAPVLAFWMGPLLAMGVAIFGVLVSFALLHDARAAREQ